MAVSNKSAGTKRSSQSAGNKTRKSTAAQKVTTRHSAPAGKRNSGSKGNTGRKASSASAARKGKSLEEMNAYQDHQAFEMGITIFVLLLMSVFLYLSCFGLAGKTGTVVGGLFFGIFGWFAWLLPLFCLIGYVFYVVNRGDRRVPRRMFSFVGIVLTLLGLSDRIFEKQIITEYYTSNHVLHRDYFECMFLTCKNVMEKGKFNGGLLGRAVGSVFSQFIGKVGAVVILFVLLLLCLYIFYGVELMGMLRKRNAYQQEMQEIYEEVSKEEDYRKPSYRVFSSPVRENAPENERKRFIPREMEKVPKVQSFDLTKMSEEPRKKAAPVPQAEKKESVKPKKEAMTKQPVSEVKLAYQEQIATQEDKVADQREKTSGIDISSARTEIDTIPIYRNELNEKFGKKKTGARVVSFANAAERKTVYDDRFVANKEADYRDSISGIEKRKEDDSGSEDVIQAQKADSAFGVEEKPKEESGFYDSGAKVQKEEPFARKIEELQEEELEDADKMAQVQDVQKEPVQQPILAAETAENLLDSERYAESMQRAEQKPMASFAPKEEVTDVTPSSQKIANCQSVSQNISEMQEPKAEQKALAASAAARHPQNISHGKIGGEDYVSASDTFNALNESKVAVEKEVPYEFPPIDLLSLPEEAAGSVSDSELRMTASKLQDTLKSFNVNVKMGAVTCGPTVTRYELLPEQGVRVNKITNLADDLKLSLAAASIRIEAPIPGKAAVGIEVPNPVPSSVYFRELLEGDSFTNAKSDLTFAVGKDIAGKRIMADIAKMPHLLIAGATGSGKSVCINTLIMSILYKADPKDVKLIMIDPKVVELSVYNGIPHLFCPVVTDPKEAAAALNWAVREMMDRYNKFKELGVRNIAGYNEKIQTVDNAEAAGYARMPYLVVIVDEFADLMMVASKEVEDAVCRLAQLARAAGIHLVLATQRPSVNVITGVIKANIPSRIAFSVSSAIDSRTILDKGGAEKLLGKGDMLFFPSGYSEPVRVQGAFVSDKEVSDVVEFLCSNNETPEYDHSVTQIMEEPKEEEQTEKKPQDDRDEYFADAGRFVIESERAAAGQLQRRFSIGFNRAGRIIDQLNKAGVVGPAEGTKPRKVLMTIEEFEQMLSGGDGISENEVESMVREMEMEAVSTEEMV